MCSCGTTVTIEGWAKPVQFNSTVLVTVNDTIRRYLDRDEATTSTFNKLYKSKYATQTNQQHQFKIRAKVTDTLYFYSPSHFTQSFPVKYLLKERPIRVVLQEVPCDTSKCLEHKHKLHVMVAKKIKLESVHRENCPSVISLDSEYAASYQVVKNLNGDFEKDTIDFKVYDHSGYPNFGRYEYVLIFIGRYCDELVHVKYQYNNVYPTDDDRWASPYDPRYFSQGISDPNVIPELISFKYPVEFPVDSLSQDQIEKRFPGPYYRISNGKATAIYGYYIEKIWGFRKSGFFEKGEYE